MYWEINVSLKGQHYFATHKRSIKGAEHCVSLVKDLRKRFPASEGFKVTATRWTQSGVELGL